MVGFGGGGCCNGGDDGEMITIEQLQVGSIVNYNIGEIHAPEWTPTALDAVDLQWLDGDAEGFNYAHRPIPLTPEILVDWCDAKVNNCIDEDANWIIKYDNMQGRNVNLGFYKNGGGSITVLFDEQAMTNIQYLHQLQHLYSALTQTVLPIQIK